MKKTLTTLFALLLGLPLFAQQGEGAFLNVNSDPAGCWVRVDSLLVGKTPLINYSLAPGEYSIQVYPPQTGIWNLQEKSFLVNVAAGETSELNCDFSRPVFINSLPYGANIYQDTSLVGITPVSLSFESYAEKELRVEKKGYITQSLVLKDPKAVLIRMEKDASYVEEEKKPQLLGVIPKRHLKSKFSLLALSVASHWAAFHFKNVADSNFDQYQLAGDPASRDRLFDKTRRYDRLSEISLGVSYASLVGLVYMVIWK